MNPQTSLPPPLLPSHLIKPVIEILLLSLSIKLMRECTHTAKAAEEVQGPGPLTSAVKIPILRREGKLGFPRVLSPTGNSKLSPKTFTVYLTTVKVVRLLTVHENETQTPRMNYVFEAVFLLFSRARQSSGRASKLAFLSAMPLTNCCCFHSSIRFCDVNSLSSSLELEFSSSSNSRWMLCHFFTRDGIFVLLFFPLSFFPFLLFSGGGILGAGGGGGSVTLAVLSRLRDGTGCNVGTVILTGKGHSG